MKTGTQKINVCPGLSLTIYNKLDNKTVDIIQDTDMIVLSHSDAKELATAILNALTPQPK